MWAVSRPPSLYSIQSIICLNEEVKSSAAFSMFTKHLTRLRLTVCFIGGRITFVRSQHVDKESVLLVLTCSKPKGIVWVVGASLSINYNSGVRC